MLCFTNIQVLETDFWLNGVFGASWVLIVKDDPRFRGRALYYFKIGQLQVSCLRTFFIIESWDL